MSNIEKISAELGKRFENDYESQIMTLIRLAEFYKKNHNNQMAFDILMYSLSVKDKNLVPSFHDLFITIGQELCKVSTELGNLKMCEFASLMCLRNAFFFHGKITSKSLESLLLFTEHKRWSGFFLPAMGFLELTNSYLNKLLKKGKDKIDITVAFKIKQHLAYTYFNYGKIHRMIKTIKEIEELLKPTRVYNTKDIADAFNYNTDEDFFKEVELYLYYMVLLSKIKEMQQDLKGAVVILEKAAIIGKKNMKKLHQGLREVYLNLFNVCYELGYEDHKYDSMIEDVIKTISYIDEKSYDRVISLLQFCDSLLKINRLGKVYEILFYSEKNFNIIFKGKKTVYHGRLDYLYGCLYNKRKDYEQAVVFLGRALENFKDNLGENLYTDMVRAELQDIQEQKNIAEKEKSSGEFIVEKTKDKSKKSKN